MRHNPTDAEQALWRVLRDRRFNDFKFRRQIPLGRYIVDFLCLSHRLVVEADGSQHAENQHDKVRDAWLADENFRVLRFWNDDILHRREEVVETLWQALNSPHLPVTQAPSPARGEGTVVASRKETP